MTPWLFASSDMIAVDSKGEVTHDPGKATGFARLEPPVHRVGYQVDMEVVNETVRKAKMARSKKFRRAK